MHGASRMLAVSQAPGFDNARAGGAGAVGAGARQAPLFSSALRPRAELGPRQRVAFLCTLLISFKNKKRSSGSSPLSGTFSTAGVEQEEMSRTADRRLRVAVRCAVLIVTVAVATSATHDEFDTCQRHLSLEEARRELAARGASLQLLSPFGAEVTGLNLAALVRDGEQSSVHNRSGLASVLEAAMAHTGVLVFRGQGVLSGDDQVRISMLFGAGEMHSTHGEHAKAGNEHIFRLSNKDGEGIVGE